MQIGDIVRSKKQWADKSIVWVVLSFSHWGGARGAADIMRLDTLERCLCFVDNLEVVSKPDTK